MNRAAIAKAMSARSGLASNVLSMKDEQFTAKFDGEERSCGVFNKKTKRWEVNVIVVDANPHESRGFFEGGYDPNNPSRLFTCWSDNGKAPSSKCEEPEAVKCMAGICTRLVWRNGEGKDTGTECKPAKKLAVVVVEQNAKKVWQAVTPPLVFRVPVTGLKPWNAYQNGLPELKRAGVDTPGIALDFITQITFSSEKKGLLVFTRTAELLETSPLFKLVEATHEAEDGALLARLTGADDKPYTAERLPGTGPAKSITAQPKIKAPAYTRKAHEDTVDDGSAPAAPIEDDEELADEEAFLNGIVSGAHKAA